jgi:hypothetical protein
MYVQNPNQQPMYFGQPMQANMGYNPIPQPKFTQPLTAQRINELRNKGTAFTLAVSQEDIDRAICTHRDPSNGTSTLVQATDGSVTCSICGHNFSPVESGVAEVEEATKIILDVLQTIKLMYLDIPEKTCAEYFQIIPLLEKIPKLFKIAGENFKKYENINPTFTSGGNMNAFNMFNMLTGPGMMQGMAPQYAQPGYQIPYQQQPMGYQSGYAMPGQNPFAYNMQQPQGQQNIQPQGQQQQVPIQGQSQTGTDTVTTTKVFHV